MAASLAFKATFRELAELHNNQPGPWVDELEATITKAVASMVPEGISIDEDASVVQFGLDLVKDLFRLERQVMAKRAGKDGEQGSKG